MSEGGEEELQRPAWLTGAPLTFNVSGVFERGLDRSTAGCWRLSHRPNIPGLHGPPAQELLPRCCHQDVNNADYY